MAPCHSSRGARERFLPMRRRYHTARLVVVTYGVREIGLWDGSMALLIDGGEGPRARPPMHLQAANGGYLRLTGPHRPLLWGRVAHDWYAVDCARPREAPIHVLPMLHADVVDAAPRGAERLG